MAKDKRMLGIGGAPTRATTLPDGAEERKKYPVASGVLDYFADAIVAVSNVSYRGNDQHNPGKPLNWNRSKSANESDTMIRHFLQRGTLDTDGTRHSAKLAWRALALLQKEIEAEQGFLGASVAHLFWQEKEFSTNDNPCGCMPAWQAKELTPPLGKCESPGGDYPHHKDFLVPKFGSQSACINWKPEEK